MWKIKILLRSLTLLRSVVVVYIKSYVAMMTISCLHFDGFGGVWQTNATIKNPENNEPKRTAPSVFGGAHDEKICWERASDGNLSNSNISMFVFHAKNTK